MKTIELVDGDIKLEAGNFTVVDKEVEVKQSLTSLLTIRKGEFFLDENIGLSRSNLFGKRTNKAEAHDDLIECLSQDDRVELINEMFFSVENRNATIQFQTKLLSTELDPVNVSGEVKINV